MVDFEKVKKGMNVRELIISQMAWVESQDTLANDDTDISQDLKMNKNEYFLINDFFCIWKDGIEKGTEY